MITFAYSVSRLANFYFFVQNLAVWHESARKAYNEYWSKELGGLPPNVKRALLQFRRMRRRYPVSQSVFEQAFFLSSSPMRLLKEKLTPADFETTQHTLAALEPAFRQIYAQEVRSLKKWERTFISAPLGRKVERDVLRTLSGLYEARPNGRVRVVLLISPPGHAGGGANIDERSLTIEVSGVPHVTPARVYGVLWHELIHLCFEKPVVLPLISRMAPEKCEEYCEVVARSLFPRGILGKRYLGLTLRADDLGTMTRDSAALLSMVRRYLAEGLSIDGAFIKELSKQNKKAPHSR